MELLILIGVLVAAALVMSAFVSFLRGPAWKTDCCPKCKGKMCWKRGQASDANCEALFQCKKCHHAEHRGGHCSEVLMEMNSMW